MRRTRCRAGSASALGKDQSPELIQLGRRDGTSGRKELPEPEPHSPGAGVLAVFHVKR